ncbi:alpha-ketoglutarate-dependent dioxygenase AlkB family protein [Tuwongella immobilis]|uniref:Fe2OG dioxygenase domain-containing protein n=1 Tax=Tuwongella immobilis TaxID=692036 RepID=A0A6C2YQS2_9BACT|nr:alpha-ketoglutarate-dependent dioxygenase AlkB [Tuwongella immobilis]VIP03345.1 2og-fe oxygenase : DNA-N1-methyladenine dioxygenase OS=Chitinophaga pinensis (strain ATCC 43595 / DSM 2588 / NCIB 11800 / UQM 2034) GN=Cpin_0845 PE=4 SV=1: 2OG-FeII_Oxy_2 [Tuwongella immobilis]VTS04062.1 2og-fe oxygenase : DNA-N1-methyladenine dioxygenase OS=Chitinophaga pinensis (strain ATCC 43595 / DSM 2588 / NCIB 11800 / UQM 2034) GN=Cpin_0845 PE=4 SV=1: 2OG-FeII_Oxy_2 [Tuwongella immobilis]
MTAWQRYSLADGGEIGFIPDFLAPAEAESLLQSLLHDTPWEQHFFFGKPIPRLTAWYGDAGVTYRYSGIQHNPEHWTQPLIQLRDAISENGSADGLDASFNSVLLNRYRNGQDSVAFHADNEPELGQNPIIASLSLGAVRRFRLRHVSTRETMTMNLTSGSLLWMFGTLQHHWEHALPKTNLSVGERVNLTFRRTNVRLPQLREG